MNSLNYYFILFFLLSNSLFAQKDCGTSNHGFIPLPDLVNQNYRGYSGGLYPNGTNQKPGSHFNDLQSLVNSLVTLDSSGSVSAQGKLVMIGVGASNPRTEFNRMIMYADTFKQINPSLKLINTCIGGQGIQKINTINDNYWNSAYQSLKDSGLSYKQVQLAWVEIDNTANPDTSFPGATLDLVSEYQALFEVLLIKFPNLKICYLSARAYSGFAIPTQGGVGKGLLYPRDYLSGWANKFFIENEINGQPGFIYKGANRTIPMVTWGSYHWSDGSTPRIDGFALECDSDVGGDGLHLTEKGEWKIGLQMFDFFRNDALAKQWFLKSNQSNGIISAQHAENLLVFPNPLQDETLHLKENLIELGTNYTLIIRDISGKLVYERTTMKEEEIQVPIQSFTKGIYSIQLFTQALNLQSRFVVK